MVAQRRLPLTPAAGRALPDERLGRQSAALTRPRERDPDLGGFRLIRRHSHRAIPVQSANLAIDNRQLEPVSGQAEHEARL